jgi:probable F420-dependent oxidoreductase
MSVRIGIGTGLAPPQPIDAFWRWIDLCEACGIDSVWTSDQMIGPSPEPLAMLSAIAARTERMRLGTNIIVIALRDPVLLAKQIAAIDFIAKGRMLPSFGVGNAVDPIWAATGRDPAARGRQSDEAIALVRMLLEQDEVEFAGEFYSYKGPPMQPRPSGPLPCWIGGDSQAAVQRTARLGDGWIGGLNTPEGAGDIVRRIKAALLETGRQIDPDHYGVSLPLRIGKDDDPSVLAARKRFGARMKPEEAEARLASFAVGSVDHVIGVLRAFITNGIEKFVALPIAEGPDDLMAQTRLLIEEVLPALVSQQPPGHGRVMV